MKYNQTQKRKVESVSASLIREIQERARLSKSDIASMCKISLATVNRMATDTAYDPHHRTFSKLFLTYVTICHANHAL